MWTAVQRFEGTIFGRKTRLRVHSQFYMVDIFQVSDRSARFESAASGR